MRALLCLSLGLVAVSLSSAAAAQEAQPKPGTPVYRDWMPAPTPIGGDSSKSNGTAPSSSSSPGQSSTAGAAGGSPEADKPAEVSMRRADDVDGPWHITLDAVFGFGVTPVINEQITGPLLTQESRQASTARFATQSLNLGLSYAVTDQLRIGLLFPVAQGQLFPDQTRAAGMVGNLTVRALYTSHLSANADFRGGLEVALPTATGDEIASADVLAAHHVNQTEQDRHSLLHAVSSSRGREDTAYYASQHLGLVPKLAIVWKAGANTEIEPYVKYSSLHPTEEVSSYEGSFVGGARLTYRFAEKVDGTLRAWVNVPVAGDDKTVAFAEPQLRGHFGPIMPILGAILPFAGELTNPYTIGVRASLLARF